MNKDLAKTLLLAAVCSATAVFAADKATPALQLSIDATTDTYSVDKQQSELEANGYIIEANELFFDGKYEEAAKSYAKARFIYEKLKNNSPHFEELFEKAKEMNAKSYYYLAQELADKAHNESNANDLEIAIKHCKQAMKIYPECASDMEDRIKLYEKMLRGVNRRNSLKEETVIPDLADSKYKVAVLLKKAKKLYYARQFEEARNTYKEVLDIDKLNPEAIQGMRATDVQISKTGMERFRLTHKKSMVEAAWKGVAPNVKLLDSQEREKISQAIDKDGDSVGSNDDDETALIRKKLNNIVFPLVSFTGDGKTPGVELPIAIKYLVDRSKQLDPTGEGVNIYLYFPEQPTNEGESSEGTPAAEEESSEAEDEEEGEKTEESDEEESDEDEESDEEEGEKTEEKAKAQKKPVSRKKYPYVNIYLDNKPLITIIDTLAQSANLKYKIEKHAVLLAPKDAKIDDMQIKVFLFDETMLKILGGNKTPQSLKERLINKSRDAVSFPPGSHVMYDPKFRSLIVLNTPDNLQEINNTLMQLRKSKPQPLVQIQCKFVEIEQSDLKELGFIQSLSRRNGDKGRTNGRLQFDTNDNVLYGPTNNTFYYNRTKLNGYDYNLTINAINQLDSKDVLSSPKVLTMNNQKVTIKMTSERYFEWDYEEGEFEINSDEGQTTYSYTPPWPEFEIQELGITMEITPKVDVKNRLITLDVHPWIKTHVGWTAYDYQVTSDNDDGGNASQTETMKRPIIAERTTDTNVAIYDNETVVIGGIIKDYTILVDDKVPVLGDLPLLGNFFKSKSSSIKKTNLLIFITARLLSQDGSPYYPTSERGRASKYGLGDIY